MIQTTHLLESDHRGSSGFRLSSVLLSVDPKVCVTGLSRVPTLTVCLRPQKRNSPPNERSFEFKKLHVAMFLAATVIIICLLWLLQRPFYWKGKGIKYMKPWPLVGNFGKNFTIGRVMIGQYLYSMFPEEKIFGFHAFFTPALMIRDPDLVNQMYVKDFDHFADNSLGSNSEYDLTGGNLLFLQGQHWKEIRAKMTPFFTPSKVKAMLLPAFDVTMNKAEKNLDEFAKTGQPCDLNKILGQIANDIITQSVFGVESDVFQNDSRFEPLASIIFSAKTNMMFLVKNLSQKLFRLLRLQSIDTDAAFFVKKIVKELVEYRKTNGIKGQDFVQGIIEIMDQFGPKNDQSNGKVEYHPDGTRVAKFDFEEMFLQALIVFIGGVESTATAMTWLFYELALHPEMQDTCREEIKSVVTGKGRRVTLDDVNELPYLNGAIKEVLRMYAPFPFVPRLCTKTYYLAEFDLTIQPGTFIMYPSLAVQRDGKYFPDPDTFRPERFVGEETKANHIATFGLGPKFCIGKSFAIYEMLLVVSQLLLKYKFTLNPKTEIPLPVGPHRPINAPSSPLWLDVFEN